MKKIILILVALLAFNANAQECGTPISLTNQVFNIPANYDAQFCVSIKFHIVRETNGTGGFDVTQIPNAINYINQFYNSHLINVSSIGFDYIDNSNLNAFDDAEFSQLTAINNVPNAINFYIVNSAPYYGRAGAIISNNLVIRIDRVLAPTAPHELGHCFNLLHTFQGTASGTGGCAELTNGSNCSSCGDNVCDTPADANIGATGGYSPDLTNTMSYYTIRDHFTTQQGARMRNAIGGSSILQATLSNQCASIVGSSSVCGISNYQYTFSNPQNTTVIWSITSNLQIITSSNTGITVKAINATISGSATITANLNGQIFTKIIWIGKPTFNISRASSQEESCDIKFHYVKYVIGNRKLSDSYSIQVFTAGVTASFAANDRIIFNVPKNYTGLLEFTVKATNSCGFTSFFTEDIINMCGATAMVANSTPTAITFKVYPNPTEEVVNIDLRNQNNQPEKGAIISGELFDLIGQSKLKVEITNNKAVFPVSGLKKGIYILKIYTNNQIENHQIIVE